MCLQFNNDEYLRNLPYNKTTLQDKYSHTHCDNAPLLNGLERLMSYTKIEKNRIFC